MIGAAAIEWVIPRWYSRYLSAPPNILTTSTSGIFAASIRITEAYGLNRFSPALLSIRPVRVCVTLSMLLTRRGDPERRRHQQGQSLRHNRHTCGQPTRVLAVDLDIDAR